VAKIEKILFILLLALLPSQLGLHWWPDWSLVNGIRIDYLSPVLFSTDLLICALFVLSVKRLKVSTALIIVFGAVVALNIYLAASPYVATWGWIKWLEALFLVWYIFKNGKLISPKWWVVALTLSLIWTAFLAGVQMVKQGSAGGWWYALGERSFNISTPGIAKVIINGRLWLRPYATFPHPNSLAGYVFLTQGLVYLFGKKLKSSPLWIRLVVPLCAILILATLSRAIIFLEIITLAILFLKRKWLWLIIALVSGSVFYLPANPLSVSERQSLNIAAYQSLFDNPVSGVGVGNFIPYISSKYSELPYQPVHNIYLLIVLELGAPVGILVILIVLVKLRKILTTRSQIAWWVFAVALSGLIDHYWLTLHQNYLLLAIFIGVVAVQYRDGRINN
jgi:hypothetical protein